MATSIIVEVLVIVVTISSPARSIRAAEQTHILGR